MGVDPGETEPGVVIAMNFDEWAKLEAERRGGKYMVSDDDLRAQNERVMALLASATSEIERLRQALRRVAQHEASGAQIGWKHWKDIAREELEQNVAVSGAAGVRST